MAVTYALWMLLSIVCERTHLSCEPGSLFWQLSWYTRWAPMPALSGTDLQYNSECCRIPTESKASAPELSVPWMCVPCPCRCPGPAQRPHCRSACPQPSLSLWTGRSAPSMPLDLQGPLQRLLDPQDHAPDSLGPRCEESVPHKHDLDTAMSSMSSPGAGCFSAGKVRQ